jgi:hypothetical protein
LPITATEASGTVKDIIEGVAVREEVDEVTGLSRFIIVDSPDEKKQQTIEDQGQAGEVIRKSPHAVARAPDGARWRGGGGGRRAGKDRLVYLVPWTSRNMQARERRTLTLRETLSQPLFDTEESNMTGMESLAITGPTNNEARPL